MSNWIWKGCRTPMEAKMGGGPGRTLVASDSPEAEDCPVQGERASRASFALLPDLRAVKPRGRDQHVGLQSR